MSHNGSICRDDWMLDWQFPTCHNMGDYGGDVYLGVRYVSEGIYEDAWTFPTVEVEQVYRSMNIYNQTSWKMVPCA